jgi:hypothetical protein
MVQLSISGVTKLHKILKNKLKTGIPAVATAAIRVFDGAKPSTLYTRAV